MRVESTGYFIRMTPWYLFEITNTVPNGFKRALSYGYEIDGDIQTAHKEYNRLIQKTRTNISQYKPDIQFLIKYLFADKPPRLIYGRRVLYDISPSQQKRLQRNIRDNFNHLMFGTEIETGLSDTDINDDIYVLIDGNYYYDGSCGIEIPTPAFKDWNEYEQYLWDVRETIRSYYGYYPFMPTRGAGGHFNVSTNHLYRNRRNVAMATVGFLPLLLYLFQRRDTNRREYKYRDMPKITDLFSSLSEKYNFLHYKSYAAEFRFPDSLYNLKAYTTEVAIITGIYVTANAGKPVHPKLFEYQPTFMYKWMIWRDIPYPMPNIFNEYIEYAKQSLFKYLDEYFDLFETKTNIDLRSRISYFVKNPKWRWENE